VRTGSDRDRGVELVRLSPVGEDLLRKVGPSD